MSQGTGRRAFSSCSFPRSPLAVVRNVPNNGLVRPSSTTSKCPKPQPLGLAMHSIGPRCRPLLFLAICLLLFLSQMVEASEIYEVSFLDEFPGELLFDIGEPPVPHMVLEARQDTATILPSSSITGGSSSSTAGSVIQTAAPIAQGTLPRPFDTSIGNNFTSASCPQFFNNFLNNETFQQCLPLSLLLQTSTGFFTASRSSLHLAQILSTSCAVDFQTCSTYMASLARAIQAPSACGADLSMRNPVVTQAYAGFVAYAPLYHAGCLADPTSDGGSGYCFADAVTNASAPASAYVYYLPLGVSMPSNALPACNLCLQETMAVFAQAAINHSVPLNGDYLAAAQQVDLGCGSGFVQANKLELANTSGAVRGPEVGFAGVLTLLVVVLMNFVL